MPDVDDKTPHGFTVEVYDGNAWTRPENDGRIAFKDSIGRYWMIQEKDGALTLESAAGELLVVPISRTKIGLETPTT